MGLRVTPSEHVYKLYPQIWVSVNSNKNKYTIFMCNRKIWYTKILYGLSYFSTDNVVIFDLVVKLNEYTLP